MILADLVEWKLARESVCLSNMDVLALVMQLIQVSVPQVFVSSQEPLAVPDSRRWSTSPLVLSTVVHFQLFQHSIQNKQLAAIQKRPDFGMIGDHGQHAVLPVDFVVHRAETEHVHLQHMDVHAPEILWKLKLAETKFAQLVHNVALESSWPPDTMVHNTVKTKRRKFAQEHGLSGLL